MKKRMLYIIFAIFFLFFNINIVNADTCADIQEKIDEYNSLKMQIEGIDCTKTNDQFIVVACNSNNTRKNLIITELMKLDEKNVICEEQKNDVNQIIEENKDKCGKIFDDSFSDFVNGFMAFFYILGPILLIFFGSLDFTKATVSSDQEALKKAWKTFSKRLVATILLFLTPTIVNFIISFNLSDKYLSGNAYSCDYKYLVYTKEYNIKYVPRKPKDDNSGIKGTIEGDYILFAQGNSAWGSEKLLCSNSETISGAGCALTSVAMQIVNSGVETKTNINPSTLNKIIREEGICKGADIYWGEARHATNNKFLLYSSSENIYGNIEAKASRLKEYISQGYYPVIQVKGNGKGTHYVAVFEVNGNEIIAGDPAGGKLVILNDTDYPIATDSYPSQVVLYMVAE